MLLGLCRKVGIGCFISREQQNVSHQRNRQQYSQNNDDRFFHKPASDPIAYTVYFNIFINKIEEAGLCKDKFNIA